MPDIFDNTILCKNCNGKMQPANVAKNGFILRAVVCPKCGSKIIHPADEAEYEKFRDLRNKEFHVKMRMVGNSYAVSIPKEIVSFIREQEKAMDDMVKLCFEDLGRLSLSFNGLENQESQNQKSKSRIINAKEYKVVRNNKPIIHSKEFYDSAHPERNKKIYKMGDK